MTSPSSILRAVDRLGFPPAPESPSVVSLGQGIYTVPQTCRILRPSMTPRRVHYWLDTELLGEPLRRGSRGISTLLTFEQVLKVRTLQHLRDELRLSLQSIRRSLPVLEVILRDLVADEWHELQFYAGARGSVGVMTSAGPLDLPAAQGVLLAPKLTDFMQKMRGQWMARALTIEGYPDLVSDAAVLAGSPTINGTRIETAFVANLASELSEGEIVALFPETAEEAIHQAAEFEGVTLLAA